MSRKKEGCIEGGGKREEGDKSVLEKGKVGVSREGREMIGI